MRSSSPLPIRLTAALLLAATVAWGRAAAAGEPDLVYFFNPETSVDNFATLKADFDAYLGTRGAYQFQPFSDHETFDTFAAKTARGLFLLSSWHYRQLARSIPLVPVMVTTHDGNSRQRAILSASIPVGQAASLKGKRVATAGTEEYARSLLTAMDNPAIRELAGTFSVLTVPKDMDALMAVGFGMADMALTSERSLATFATVNPKGAERLHPLAKGEQMLRPVLVQKGKDGQLTALAGILADMQKSPEGVRHLRLLGFDGWKKLSADDAVLLEGKR